MTRLTAKKGMIEYKFGHGKEDFDYAYLNNIPIDKEQTKLGERFFKIENQQVATDVKFDEENEKLKAQVSEILGVCSELMMKIYKLENDVKNLKGLKVEL